MEEKMVFKGRGGGGGLGRMIFEKKGTEGKQGHTRGGTHLCPPYTYAPEGKCIINETWLNCLDAWLNHHHSPALTAE